MQVMCKEDPTKICEGACGRGCASCTFHQVQGSTVYMSKTCPLTMKPCELTQCIGPSCCLMNPIPQQQTGVGWSCPKCGSVYSPSTSECWRCNKQHSVTTFTTTISSGGSASGKNEAGKA